MIHLAKVLFLCDFFIYIYIIFNWRISAFSSGQVSSVQLLSRVQLFVTPWAAACQASVSITNSWSPPKPVSTESVMPSNHLILCRPLLLLLSIFPSIRVFSKKSVLCTRWPKYWCFSFNISPSSEHPGLISFRMDWLDLLAVQETLKSLLQHHSSKAPVLYNILYKILFTKIKSGLQYCICFCCTNSANLLQVYMYPLPPKPPFHPHLRPQVIAER